MSVWAELQADPWLWLSALNGALILLFFAHVIVRAAEGGEDERERGDGEGD